MTFTYLTQRARKRKSHPDGGSKAKLAYHGSRALFDKDTYILCTKKRKKKQKKTKSWTPDRKEIQMIGSYRSADPRVFEDLQARNVSIGQNSFWKGVSQAPVFELSTGISYLNFSVFTCFNHNLSDFFFWDISIMATQFTTLTSLESLIESFSTYGYVYFPGQYENKFMHGQCFSFVKQKCEVSSFEQSLTHNLSELTEKCNTYFSFVQVNHTIYKNEFCAKCNHLTGKIKYRPKYVATIKGRFVYTVSLGKQDIFLTYEFGKSPEIHDSLETYGSWTHASCNLPTSQAQSGKCQVLKCSHHFTMRPNGVCATLFWLGIGFPEDEFPISKIQMKQIHAFLSCELEYLDLADNDVIQPYVYQYSSHHTPVFVFQISFYSDRLLVMSAYDQKTVALISKILDLVKSFKFYRMQTAANISEHQKIESKETNTNIHVRKPPKYVLQQVSDIVDSLHSDKGPVVEGMWSVSACVCHSLLNGQYFDCTLVCFNDQVFEEDLKLFNSSVCRDRFSGKISGDVSSGRNLQVMTSVVVTIFTFFCFQIDQD